MSTDLLRNTLPGEAGTACRWEVGPEGEALAEPGPDVARSQEREALLPLAARQWTLWDRVTVLLHNTLPGEAGTARRWEVGL